MREEELLNRLRDYIIRKRYHELFEYKTNKELLYNKIIKNIDLNKIDYLNLKTKEEDPIIFRDQSPYIDLLEDGLDDLRRLSGQIPSHYLRRTINPEEIVASVRERSSQQNEEKTMFLINPSRVLSFNDSAQLRSDEGIVLESIKRDINSICYTYTFTENIKSTAIFEAKKQGYTFKADTPAFMMHNPDLIKMSLSRDINSLNFVPPAAWTEDLKEYAIKLALKNGYVLCDYSGTFLRSNIEIIKQSLKHDYQSAIYVKWDNLTNEEIADIEKFIIENNLDFVISSRTPINFKRNVDICIKSAKLDPDSLNYVDWEYLAKTPEQLDKLCLALIEQEYVLTASSPEFLKNATRICLNSIKNNIYSARHFSKDLKDWLDADLDEFPVKNKEDEEIKENILEIRHYLILNGYYSFEDFLKLTSTLLKDDVTLDYYLKKMGISDDTDDKNNHTFYEIVKEFIKKAFSTPLKVADIKKVFSMVSLKKWEEFKRENNDHYTNIFNRICDSLEKNNNFISALNELKFLMKVDDVLDERKYALFNAFIEYHQIYHGPNVDNKIELLQAKRDEISAYSALFISKSKEDFLSEKINEFSESYKQFFVIRIDNPIVKKKVVEVKQRAMLKGMFENHDPSLIAKLNSIKDKYLTYNYHSAIKKDIIPQILDLFETEIITKNISSIDDILSIEKPPRFDEYENYEKVSKLINRLNSHNIKFDGPEVDKYRCFISFDGEKYVYKGNTFDENEIAQIMAYKDLKYVFGKIRSEIIQIAKGIDSFDNLTQEDIKTVIGECPFSDEYYTFDFNVFNQYYIKLFNEYLTCFENNKELVLNDTSYKLFCNLMIDNGLFATSIITTLGKDSVFKEISSRIVDKEIIEILANMPSLLMLIAPEEFIIENIDKILDFKELIKHASIKQINLLGSEVLKKIYTNNGYTSASQSERISVACDLLSSMVSVSSRTVPFINGSFGNYRYSMYDSQDETLLTAGLDTNACFRCCGNDNDFLHYCALDKNGFVIKLTDNEGNFIGRASGFRNGNGVYINQLRTIYDKKSSAYESERQSIIKTFELACNDIVEISQSNPNEEQKIDFVVVTKSYSLSDTPSNVSEATANEIGNNPMDSESDDWTSFINNRNLRESVMREHNYFNTDFGGYQIICMKSAIGELTPDKIHKKDVPALYIRNRKGVNVGEFSPENENIINRIRAIYSHLTGEEFKLSKYPKECRVITGDNWFIILDSKGILDGCCLPTDAFAKEEFTSVMEQIKNNQNIEDVLGQEAIKR